MKNRIVFALACFVILAACSDKQDDSAAAKTPPPGTGPVKISSGNVFSPLVQDLNKAKALNGQVQQQGKATDQAIESASSASAPAPATNDPD